MNLKTNALMLDGNSVPIFLLNIPDTCPICHKSIHPKNVGNFLLFERDIAQVVFRCTSQKCEEAFIATYNVSKSSTPYPCVLISVAPIKPKKHDFSQTILGVSPSFVEIYNQALAAEAAGLTEMVGIGLRKALEFLIKDFAIQQKQSDEETIKKTFLGKCILYYIDDTNVKECAKRAAWLGNDETHYIRKWEDKDVSDLKLLIRLTVNWIDNVLLTQKYINEMDESCT